MQPINFESTPLSSLLIWFAIGVTIIIILAYFYVKITKAWERWCNKKDWQEREYEERYNEIDKHLKDTDANNPLAKGIIGAELKKLKSLEWQNKEKTRFITLEFLKRFYGGTEKVSEKNTEREFIKN